ncbi:hypothetical protein HMPREF1587_00468 [Bifidobacterium breve JCP7499]|nr:hypothetical protein HMPREF1587_00468 [Bifidobacterium breve JCP7499]
MVEIICEFPAYRWYTSICGELCTWLPGPMANQWASISVATSSLLMDAG